MIRVLVMIAVAGFLVSVVTLTSAISIGGPELLADGFWNMNDGHFGWTWDSDDDDGHSRRHGGDGSREMAWTGGDTLDVEVPAEVTYTQAAGPGKLLITGPKRELDDLVVEGGHLRFGHGRHHRHDGELTVVMSAPTVTHFAIDGSGRLAIEGYNQDKLGLDITGDAEVTVKGEAKSLGLDLAGSGNADLSGLKVTDADVNMEGSGQATVGPTGAANVQISGSGEVTLLNRPSRLESNISGSGAIHQHDGPPAPPQPPRPPKPPPEPHAPVTKT